MARFLVHWLIVAVALWVTAYILPGVHVESTSALAVGALVLGFVNAVLRPLLILLTLPITVVTLGLFLFVINALTLSLAAAIVPGFRVDGFWWALLGALLVSLASSFLAAAAGGGRRAR